MKTIELNISERIFGLLLLNNFKGNLDVMSVILEDIKQFPISDEEWSKAEQLYTDNEGVEYKSKDDFEAAQRAIPEEKRGGAMKWNDEAGGLKAINIQKETGKYLIDTITEKSDKGELTLRDKAALTFKKKLI